MLMSNCCNNICLLLGPLPGVLPFRNDHTGTVSSRSKTSTVSCLDLLQGPVCICHIFAEFLSPSHCPFFSVTASPPCGSEGSIPGQPCYTTPRLDCLSSKLDDSSHTSWAELPPLHVDYIVICTCFCHILVSDGI